MEIPYGSEFLEKVRLYSQIRSWDRRMEKMQKRGPTENFPVWPIEKAILRWTYLNHKHLGSPLTDGHLSLGSQDNKLKDFGMLDSDGGLKPEYKFLEKGRLARPYENLAVKGLAEYPNETHHGHTQIVVNEKGLLFGEVLNETELGNPLVKLLYFFYAEATGKLGATLLLVFVLIGVLAFVRFVVSSVS